MSHSAYSQALELLKISDMTSPTHQLYNNVGSLTVQAVSEYLDQQKLSTESKSGLTLELVAQLESAHNALKGALEILDKSMENMDEKLYKIDRSVVIYNIGRLQEVRGETIIAEKTYHDLIEFNPRFVSAIMRLSMIASEQGDISKAIDFLTDALAIDEKNTLAWALLASMHVSKKDVKSARKCFEHVLQKIDKYDAYALCSTGNMCLDFARGDPKQVCNFFSVIN